MHPIRAAGVGLTAVALVAYVAGMFVPYPGRALSLTALMVGATLLFVGGDRG
jgi:hypothetical protein